MSKILYIFLMLIGIPLILNSQPTSIQFKHISTEDGLSNITVSCIIQDYLGFMWFGTVDGLCKYDGYKFTTYRNDPRDTTTLSNNEIWALLEDRNNNLWIGTRGGGLNLFNREKEEFISYKHDENNIQSISHNIIRSMMEDKDGRLWIGTLEGLNWFDIENNRFVRYSQNEDNSSLGINTVRSIYEDSNNNFWLGTIGNGLQLFDRSTHKFVQFIHDPEDSNSLVNNTVWWILEDSYGKLWLATDNGLDCIDLTKNNVEFKHYQHDESDPGSLSNASIITLYEDTEKNLWVGTELGINLFDRVNDAFIHYSHDDFSEGSLSDNSVWSIYQDRAGLLWFGTHWGGLNIYNSARHTFKHYTYNSLNPEGLSENSILAFHEDKDGDIWIGVDPGGLNLFNRENDTFKHYRYNPNDPNSIGSDAVLTFGEDSYGNLWVGTWGGGLNRFDKKSGNVVRYVPNENDSSSLCNLNVYAIFEDGRKNLWIGTHNCGLHLYNRGTDSFTHFYPDMNDPTAISSGRVWVIFEDSKEGLWIGTSDGINLFDRDKKTFKVFKHDENNELRLSSSIIRTIYEDTKGNLWFGTAGGLNLFDRKNETFKSYNVRHGLPNDMVSNILEDNHGNLWLGTFNGLSRFDLETETFHNYEKNDGLLSNQFNHRSCLRINTGEMFFGSPEGFISFHPDSVKINEQIPPVVITDFNILNKPVDIGPDSPLKQHINLTKEITLTHRDYVFSFEFAALDYSIPGKNLYKYKLENFNEDWNYTTAKNRIATYTNLDHGKYIFQVQGSNNDGVWNSEGVSIEINVLPPWWKTSLFRGSVLILVIGIIFATFEFRTRSIRNRKRQLEIEVADRTRDLVKKSAELQQANISIQKATRLKSAFLANMSHELRTPLNSIIGFTGIILREIVGKLNEEQKKQLNMAYDSAKHLLGLINDVLDLSKIEAGKIEIVPVQFEVNELFNMVEKMVSPMIEEKGLKLQIGISGNVPQTIYHDKNRIKQVLINLLSNANKFTESDEIGMSVRPSLLSAGSSSEEFDKEDLSVTDPNELKDKISSVVFSIADTGIGVKPEYLPEIFDEFRQIEGPLKEKPIGTGLGLPISKKMVETMGGRIWAKSEYGKGSLFQFSIPVKESPDKRRKTAVEADKLDKSKKLVLTIDDEVGAQEILKTYLKNEGYEVIQAYNAMEAMEFAKEYNPFAITLDIIMPGKDGWDILKELKEDPQTENIPVICISILDNRQMGLSLGAFEYMTKPVSEEQLFKELRRLEKRFKIYDILLVDDDYKIVELLSDYIAEANDYTIRKAYNGKEALSEINRKSPDLIILDLIMPEINGFEVIRSLKKSEKTRDIPIIILSAKKLSQEETAFLNSNIEKIIRKGDFRKDELLGDIKRALEKIRK